MFLSPDLDASAGFQKVFSLSGAFQFNLMRKGWYICRSKSRNYHRVEVVTDYNMATNHFLKRCSFTLRPLGPKENPLMNCYGTFQPTRPPGVPQASISTPSQTIKTTPTTRLTTPPTTHRPEGKWSAILLLSIYIFKQLKTCTVFLSTFSINLPALYHECRSLIGYATHFLICDTVDGE